MDYDTKEGIAAQLGAYADLYSLMKERKEQGHEHGNLTPFVVLGRYYTDQAGQCIRLGRKIFSDDERRRAAPVMTMAEFSSVFGNPNDGREVFEGTLGTADSFPLAPPHLVCSRCSGIWDLESCHDIDNEGKFEELDLSPFIGKTLLEVEELLVTRTDALIKFSPHPHLQNPQWADPSIDVDDEAEQTFLAPEQKGWRKVTFDHIVQTGDRINPFHYRYYHGSCFRQMQQERIAQEELAMLDEIAKVFGGAGFDEVKVTKTDVPQHLRDWIASDLSEGEDLEEEIRAWKYFRAETKQGNFGIAVEALAFLDLEGTGVSLKDMDPGCRIHDPAEKFPLLTFTGETAQLLCLWQLLVRASQ